MSDIYMYIYIYIERERETEREFYSKNKFEKLVHLVGFVIRIYHDARSSECRIELNLHLLFHFALKVTVLHN
jgi:hypothetical protein